VSIKRYLLAHIATTSGRCGRRATKLMMPFRTLIETAAASSSMRVAAESALRDRYYGIIVRIRRIGRSMMRGLVRQGIVS